MIVVVVGFRQRTEDVRMVKTASDAGVEKRILNNLGSNLLDLQTILVH